MDKFISIKNFKHLFKLLNKYSEQKYDNKLDFKKFKKIIGNTMYEINDNFGDKIKIQKKNIMTLTVLKEIIDEKNQVEDFFKMEDNNFNLPNNEIKDNMFSMNNYNNYKNQIEKKDDINILEKKLDNERKIYEKIISSTNNIVDKNLIQDKNMEKFREQLIIEKPKTDKINLEENIKNINQDILISPEEYKKTINKYIKHYDLIIDSRDRNHDNYDSNKYIIDLNNEINNIFSVELLEGSFPNSEYLINENNNILHIEETLGNIVEVTIPIGNYSQLELLQIIENSLNSNINLNSTYKLLNKNVLQMLNSFESNDDNFYDYTGLNIQNIFDTNLSTYWESNLNLDNPSYFIYDFSKKVLISEYSLLCKENIKPSNFTLDISNDKNIWTNIHNVTNQVYSSNKYKTYNINNNLYARYVRFTVTNTNFGNTKTFKINEIQFKRYVDDYIQISSDLVNNDQNYFNLRFFGGYDINNQPIYLKNSIGSIIGFSPIDLLNYPKYTSQNKVIFKNDQNIILDINNDINFHIVLESEKNNYTYIKGNNVTNLVTLDKLYHYKKLNITIKRKNNNLYYFNGLDHSFLLRFYYYNTNQVFQ